MKRILVASLFSASMLFTAGAQADCLSENWYRDNAIQALVGAGQYAHQAASGGISNSDRAFLDLAVQTQLNQVGQIGSTHSDCLSPSDQAFIAQVLNREALNLAETNVETQGAAIDAESSIARAIRVVRINFGGGILSTAVAMPVH